MRIWSVMMILSYLTGMVSTTSFASVWPTIFGQWTAKTLLTSSPSVAPTQIRLKLTFSVPETLMVLYGRYICSECKLLCMRNYLIEGFA